MTGLGLVGFQRIGLANKLLYLGELTGILETFANANHLFLASHERIDDFGVEMGAASFHDDIDGFLVAEGFFVRAFRR